MRDGMKWDVELEMAEEMKLDEVRRDTLDKPSGRIRTSTVSAHRWRIETRAVCQGFQLYSPSENNTRLGLVASVTSR